jgi:DNA-binding transcriptional MerR regulator
MAVLVTIGELALAVQQALAETAYPGQKSGRIREVPDRRTIRYYTTIGLLDKPAEMRGRTAYYGPRHLMQLVAIKRLQVQGKSLVEIQAVLTGAGDSALAKWSALPAGFADAIEQGTGKSEPGVSGSSQAGREDFWAAAPRSKPEVSKEHQEHSAVATTAVHLKVTGSVTLVIEGVEAAAMDAKTLSKLKPVLENLKKVLDQNGSIIERESGNEKERTDKTKPANDNEREQP